jgi:hypothetical protein
MSFDCLCMHLWLVDIELSVLVNAKIYFKYSFYKLDVYAFSRTNEDEEDGLRFFCQKRQKVPEAQPQNLFPQVIINYL